MQEGDLQYVSRSLYRAIGGLAFGLSRIPHCGRVDSPAPRCGRHLLDRAFRAGPKRRVKHHGVTGPRVAHTSPYRYVSANRTCGP